MLRRGRLIYLALLLCQTAGADPVFRESSSCDRNLPVGHPKNVSLKSFGYDSNEQKLTLSSWVEAAQSEVKHRQTFWDADATGFNVGPGPQLQNMQFVRTCLRGAHFEEGNLMGAALNGADLRGADVRDANLSFIDVRAADLRGVELKSAATLQQALFNRYTKLSPKSFGPGFLGKTPEDICEEALRRGMYAEEVSCEFIKDIRKNGGEIYGTYYPPEFNEAISLQDGKAPAAANFIEDPQETKSIAAKTAGPTQKPADPALVTK